jgi:translation initiation factor 1
MTEQKSPFHNPFGALKSLRDSLPASPEPPAQPETTAPSAPVKTIARAVVRIERSGRGGKEVTVVEQLTLSAADREGWLKELKSALGCGGVIEGDALVLQGDQRKRLPKLLEKRGVKKVTLG